MGSSSSSVVDTKFYDSLGVSPDVTVADLHKAYKRRALRLHPDKGGDPEEFKNMKDAYDVLIDPEKRKAYDKFGPEVLSIINGEGPPSVEAMMAIIKNVTKRERMFATLAVCCVASFVISPVVMFSMRWDDDNHMNWAFTLIPVWLLEAVALFGFLTRASLPEPEDLGADVDEEGRAMYAEIKRSFRVMKVVGSTCIVLLASLQAFVVAKLQGGVDWSWLVVLSPWTLLELIMLVSNIAQSRSAYATEVKPPRFVYFLVQRLSWGLARFATSLLVAMRAQMLFGGSWIWCLIPMIALGACKFSYAKHLDKSPSKSRERRTLIPGAVVRLDGLQSRPDLNGQVGTATAWDEEKSRWNVSMPDGSTLQLKPGNLKVMAHGDDPGNLEAGEAEAENQSPHADNAKDAQGGHAVAAGCGIMLWLPWLIVAACKLDGDGMSAFIIFVPVLILVCAITCFFSCAFLCITPEAVQAMAAQRAADAHPAGGNNASNPNPQSDATPNVVEQNNLSAPLLPG